MVFKMDSMRIRVFSLGLILMIGAMLFCCNDNNNPKPTLLLVSLQIGNENLLEGVVNNTSIDQPIIASFNLPVDTVSLSAALSIVDDQNNSVVLRYNFFNENKTISIYPEEPLKTFTQYTVSISDELLGANDKESYPGAEYAFITIQGKLTLESILAGNVDLKSTKEIRNVPLDLQIRAAFSDVLDEETINLENIFLKRSGKTVSISTTIDGNILMIEPAEEIDYWSAYDLVFETMIEGEGAIDFDGFETSFITELDSSLKFSEVSDKELLTKVQEQTFKYFWDFGHPVSGLARERNTSGETVTSGGSGFGVMSIIVGIERGFITREEGTERLLTIVNFLLTKADRFHGVWSHWLNGTTGEAIPFSSNDDGGDLVETAFMIQGLLTARQYLNEQDPSESEIISKINLLWNEIEWDWYTQGGQDVLYWHWSPNFEWEKNHKITGWNESLIVYVLAASSPTHSIDEEVYSDGWSREGAMVNLASNSYFNYTLPLRTDRGGPLFFSHYSFLGLDPRNLSDQFADYWEQNVNHTLINRAYCIDNPKNYIGYTAQSWGLTASDGNAGYSAHSPDNDRGVITPTAALSSIPYTPEESMAAMRHFYYILGDRLWGEYGFYDAFNITENWTAPSYLAIDQGPIVVMIENYRTGLLWDLFMSAPEVQNGLTKLGFTYE